MQTRHPTTSRLHVRRWLAASALWIGAAGAFAQRPVLPPVPIEPGDALTVIERGGTVLVNDVQIDGNSVIDTATLEAIATPYLGQQVDYAALAALRDALTLAYVERGYVSSGALIEPDALAQGRLSIRIVEGVLGEVRIDNPGRLREGYVRKRLAYGEREVVNVVELEARLQRLQLDDRIDSLRTELLPGERSGESVLAVTVDEARPFRARLSLSNRESPNVGETRALASFEHTNVSGLGDRATLRLRHSEGLTGWSASYRMPIGARGGVVFVAADDADSEIVEDGFEDLDIESQASTYTLGVDWPLYRSAQTQLSVSASLSKRHSDSFLLGIPFSFTPGVEDGEADITVLRLAQTLDRRSRQRAWVLRSTFSVGLDAFDATVGSGDQPDGTFVAWLGQGQWAQRLPWRRSQLIARAEVQVANSALLGMERYAIGGHANVRGYRETTFSSDNGAFVSLAWQVPVLSSGGGMHTLALGPFLDAGRVWSDDDAIDAQSLASTGLAVHWRMARGWQAQLEWAHGFDDVGGSGTLQDNGLHLWLSYTLPGGDR